jgi:hypothetical protein
LTGVSSGAEVAYFSSAPDFIPVFSGVCVAKSFCIVFFYHYVYCMFVLFRLTIVLSVLGGFTASDNPFGIF